MVDTVKKEAILNNLEGRIRQVSIKNYQLSKEIESLINKIHPNPLGKKEELIGTTDFPEENIVAKLEIDILGLSETNTLLTNIYSRLKDLVG